MKKVFTLMALLIASISFAQKAGSNAAGNKPDLFIKKISVVEATKNRQTDLHTVKVSLTIINNGQVSSGNTVLKMMIQNSDVARQASQGTVSNPWLEFGSPVAIKPLDAGKELTGTVTFTEKTKVVTGESFRASFIADPLNSVDESDETNNASSAIEINPVPEAGALVAMLPGAAVQGKIELPTRFSTDFSIPGFSDASGFVAFKSPARYNLDPQNISINRDGIRIGKRGLYHFELYVESQLQLKNATSLLPRIVASLSVGQLTPYNLFQRTFLEITNNHESASNNNFFFGELVSFDIYVEAGSLIRVHTSISSPVGPFRDIQGVVTGGHLSGYLISE